MHARYRRLAVMLAFDAFILFLPLGIHAGIDPDQPEYVTISSGTGFYVTANHIITNEHVVQNCKEIYIRGDVNIDHTVPRSPAQLVGVDKNNDLALLQTTATPMRIAVLRANNGIKKGDPVLVMGYPLEHGETGVYYLAKGTITEVEGEFNHEKRVEFTDSVRQGNSGGPLLDANGNIMGVIVGMLNYYETRESVAQQVPTRRTSVAIPLHILKQFLMQNRIVYRLSNTYGKIPDNRLEESAKHTIVNIHCIQNE